MLDDLEGIQKSRPANTSAETPDSQVPPDDAKAKEQAEALLSLNQAIDRLLRSKHEDCA